MSATVIPSEHLERDRWPQRGNPEEDVCAAWERAEPFTIDAEGVPWNDEARYDARTNTVLFRREHTLTTCYSLHPEFVDSRHGRLVREAVREQFWRDGEPANHHAVSES